MRKMKGYITCLLLGVIVLLSFAQQNQTTHKSDPEVETLKKRISELEGRLQTIENVEKMELAAKLADANAKLRNAEIDKYTRGLKDTNNEWLRTWSLWFVGILSFLVVVIGGAFWSWLRSRADQLIEDSVERSLSGFKEALAQVETLKNELKEAVGQVNILQNQIRILEKEHAASVLENFMNTSYSGYYPQSIEVLGKEILLQVFGDKKYRWPIRDKAVEVLAARKSPQLVSPALKFLNSVVDSDFNQETFTTDTARLAHRLIYFLGGICTDKAYQGLEKFLNRLLNESLKHKDLFLTGTVFSLANVSVELNIKDSTPILKSAVSHLQDPDHNLSVLAKYFDKFNEPESIKEILTNGLTDEMPDVETQCLELLQKHDPDFVEDWKAQKEATNTETEESS